MSFSGGVIGLDIGTQTCVISQAKRGGIETVMDESSSRKTASLVSFQGNERMIAAAAAPIAKSNYKNTVRCAKRLIGRDFKDPFTQNEISKLPNSDKFVELDNGQVGVKVNFNDEQVTFSMEQVTAMLINKLRACVSKDDLPSDVVISVPGWWNEKQRKSMLSSCEIAGFNALRLLNDHTAAALSYGIYKSARNVFDAEKKQVVMFIDVGYSNTSVAIVGFIQGKLQVLSAAYDPCLGGRDFDEIIFSKFADEFQAKHKLDVRTNPKSILKLTEACEKAKQTLTPEGVNLAKITVEFLMNEIDFSSQITLEEFEEKSQTLLARLQKPIEQALAAADLKHEEVECVEIVGGGTRPKIVKKALATYMKTDLSAPNYGLSTTLNLDESVARGCALNSAMLSPVFRVKEFNVYDSVALPVTLTWDQADTLPQGEEDPEEDPESGKSVSGTNSVTIVQKAQSVPCTKRVTFRRNQDFEISAKYEVEENSPDKDILPPNFDLNFAKFKIIMDGNKDPEKTPLIRVDFSLDRNGLFDLVSAEALYEIAPEPKAEEKKEEPKKDEKEEEKKETGETEEKKDAEKKEEEKQEKPKEEKKPVKKKYKKHKLKVVSTFVHGLKADELKKLADLEKKYREADRKIAETAEAKNELEAYIYSFRDKVDMTLKEYIKEAEKTEFSELLSKEESWLYDDGFDESKDEYRKRLGNLKSFGDRYEARQREHERRPTVIQILKGIMTNFTSVINSTEEKYDHINDEEREKVRKIMKETSEWLDHQVSGQEKLGKDEDPVLTEALIQEQIDKLNRAGLPVVNKRRPPPPKPKKEEKMETDDAAKKDEETPDANTEKAKDGEEEKPEGQEPEEATPGMEVD